MYHRDCKNFAPVDVAKGICHITKEMIAADDKCCKAFDRISKCRYCRNFQADKEKTELGICKASSHYPPFMAYPDMIAITCEMYKES